ncbi:FG-GAP and VCBS repeat-containing protein [Streptomyces sp. NPDC049099]|uniref:FG-GAP and VCBS repeat-containing protein n=1 Tax=Streptomyces sp. NPDC049099 TaxID=3155768 RepID=UPI00341216DD
MRRVRTVAALATATLVSAGSVVLGAGGPAVAAGSTATTASAAGETADFNKDGYGDLAVSAHGCVVVMYGTATGLTASRHQTVGHCTGPNEPWGFGLSMTTGDLDGDGYDDLVAFDDATSAVTVDWGGPTGLSSRTQLAVKANVPIPMVAADFDGDGKDDLVVSDSYWHTELLRGPFTRDGANASTSPVDNKINSGRLVAGDVNGDHVADLLSVGRNGGDSADASLVLGSKSGFGPAKVFSTKVNSGSIADVDGDGYGDVVLGAGLEGYQPAGVVGGSIVVRYGSAGGISTTRPAVRISQDTTGVPGAGEKYDRFGFNVDTGDVNGDGYADVAIGVEQESISGVSTTGAVTVLRGSAKGLTATGAVSWHQNTTGVAGVDEAYDRWGQQVSLADMNGDGRSELVVGTDSENIYEGNLWYFKSGSAGLTTSGSVSVGPRTFGLTPEQQYFARTVAK